MFLLVKDRSAITRNDDGYISLCPNCLEKESKVAFIKGDKMSDTGERDGHMPVKLTVVVRAESSAAIVDALVALVGRVSGGDLVEGKPTMNDARAYSVTAKYRNDALTPDAGG